MKKPQNLTLASFLSFCSTSHFLGPLLIILASGLRGFDAPVRNPLLFAAPNVMAEVDWDASEYTSPVTPLGLSRASSFLSMIEHFIGVVFLGVGVFLIGRGFRRCIPAFKSFDKRDWFSLAFVSFGGSALALYFFLISMTLGKPVIAILFQQLQPLWTALFAFLLLKEKPSIFFLFGAITSIIAVVIIAIPDFIDAAQGTGWIHPAKGWNALLADLFSFIAAFFWGSSTVFGRILSKKVKFMDLAFYRYLGGFLFLIGLAACNVTFSSDYFNFLGEKGILTWGYLDYNTYPPTQVLGSSWSAVACIFWGAILTGGIVPLGLYYLGLPMLPSLVAGFCELSFPLVAIFVNHYFLNYTLNTVQIIGAVLLLLSVAFLTWVNGSQRALFRKKNIIQQDVETVSYAVEDDKMESDGESDEKIEENSGGESDGKIEENDIPLQTVT